MSSMKVYLVYMVILSLYTTVIVLNNILKIWFENFSSRKDSEVS